MNPIVWVNSQKFFPRSLPFGLWYHPFMRNNNERYTLVYDQLRAASVLHPLSLKGSPMTATWLLLLTLFFLPWEMYNYLLFHVELGRMTCLPNKMWVQVETLEGIAKWLAHSLQFLLREPLPWEAPTDGVDLSPTADWDQKPNSWPTDALGWKTHAWLLSKALECKGSYLLHGLSNVVYPNWHKFSAHFYLQMKKFNCRGMY